MTKLEEKKLIHLIETIENEEVELNESNFNILLLNYKATLSLVDQKIFFLFRLFDEKNTSIDPSVFIKFGSDILNFEDGKNKKFSPIGLFMNKFNKNIFKETILHSPSNISFEKVCDSNLNLYDLRFILLSFNQILNLDNFNLEEFINFNCFALIIASLSLEDSILRKFTYIILFKLSKKCNNSYGKIWKIYLHLIKASLKYRNERLSNLITSFLIFLIPFLKNPIYSNHENIVKFLVNKPALDMKEIMIFLYNMLKTDDEKSGDFYKNIALLILENGIKNDQDYIFCKNYNIINLLLIAYNSPMIMNQNLKIKILDVFDKMVIIKVAVQDLCNEKAFFLWLNQIMLDEFDNTDILIKLEKINQILLTMFNHIDSLKPIYKNELYLLKSICTRKLDFYFEKKNLELN